MDIIGILNSLGEENRLRIYNILKQKAACMCELYMLLDLSQAKVSRYLAGMRAAGIIQREKEGQWICYQITAEFLYEEPDLIAYLDRKLIEFEVILEDNRKLEIYLSENISCMEVKETPGKVFTILHQNH